MVPRFETRQLPAAVDAVAPDGSDVRVLVDLPAGSLAHFTLPAGATSVAVRHRTVSELWYVVSGVGQMWRAQGSDAAVVDLRPGTALTIPVGTAFQFRATGDGPLRAVGATMPPWPGAGEAEIVAGSWEPTVRPGPA